MTVSNLKAFIRGRSYKHRYMRDVFMGVLKSDYSKGVFILNIAWCTLRGRIIAYEQGIKVPLKDVRGWQDITDSKEVIY